MQLHVCVRSVSLLVDALMACTMYVRQLDFAESGLVWPSLDLDTIRTRPGFNRYLLQPPGNIYKFLHCRATEGQRHCLTYIVGPARSASGSVQLEMAQDCSVFSYNLYSADMSHRSMVC